MLKRFITIGSGVLLTIASVNIFADADNDQRIKADIESKLSSDPVLGTSALKVYVEDGNVRISGGLGSMDQKNAAESFASSVTGVQSVDISGISAPPPPSPQSPPGGNTVNPNTGINPNTGMPNPNPSTVNPNTGAPSTGNTGGSSGNSSSGTVPGSR